MKLAEHKKIMKAHNNLSVFFCLLALASWIIIWYMMWGFINTNTWIDISWYDNGCFISKDWNSLRRIDHINWKSICPNGKYYLEK